MNYILFSEKMKLADLILANYKLLYVFPCFEIELGFGECTVKQACAEKGISTSLFQLVCNVYTFDDYTPDINVLAQIPLIDLMRYLQNSHKNYIENRMPTIINRILDLVDDNHIKHKEILNVFCEKYRQEVITHFNYEEHVVFPYIATLLKGEKTNSYKIEKYKSNHSDLDAALSDLKNITMKYLPVGFNFAMCRNILIGLFLFEVDLNKHTLLEERILISLVEQMENSN